MFTKKLKKAALATAITASLGAGSVANADIVDNPTFQLLGAVVVWGGSDTGQAMVNDFVISDGTTTTDLIGDNVQPLITGTLTNYDPTGIINTTDVDLDPDGNGILDATLSAFSPTGGHLNNPTQVQTSSFYVASNTNFSINATVIGTPANQAAIQRTLSVTLDDSGDLNSFGNNARLPYDPATDSPFLINDTTLDAIDGQTVFAGTRGTADTFGTIAEQSVRFDHQYSLVESAANFNSGPQTYTAEVTYAIAIP